MNRNKYLDILTRFQGKNIVVIGDLIADEHIFCETSRVSREAPVLILQHLNELLGLGGGFNVAQNLAQLGTTVTPIGMIGKDYLGHDLLALVQSKGIQTDGILQKKGFTTISKTRILACSLHTTMQQVLRIDRGEQAVEVAPHAEQVEKQALQFIEEADAVILSDYGYGSLSDKLLHILREKVVAESLLVTVDSRYSLNRFHSLTAITPNEPEVQKIVGCRLVTQDNLVESGYQLLEKLNQQAVLITRGKMGMALFVKHSQPNFIPVYGSDEVADVTGAGDTVIATFTLSLASGASFEEAALLSNYAGGIVVTKRGAMPITVPELRQALAS